MLSLTQIYGKAYFNFNYIIFCQATIKVIKNNFYLLYSQPLQSSLLDIILFSVSLTLFFTIMLFILSYFFYFFKHFLKIKIGFKTETATSTHLYQDGLSSEDKLICFQFTRIELVDAPITCENNSCYKNHRNKIPHFSSLAHFSFK